ncbi:NUDIX hydrolase [Streptomyces sp. NPDC054904]|uniref:NUDIX hydrolase n=1 Tax=unclassified Streptomyces TaxID=2593676 RepID=UPI002481C832|nr:NUDIX hydrolase [Streptomyces sp. Isolate_45]MDA5279800.1 NUDIX hydrolase [Streptomyces sp. Isolate_45]
MSRTIVSAVVEQDGCLLMVRERPPAGPEQWVLPGGVVEPGELAHDAMVREVHEETGLTVAGPTGLACVSQHAVTDEPGWDGTWTVITFRAERPTGTLGPLDPDGEVLEAAWVPLDEARARLAAHPFRRRGEPLIAYLTGTAPPGALWLWPDGPQEPPVVIPAAATGPITRGRRDSDTGTVRGPG